MSAEATTNESEKAPSTPEPEVDGVDATSKQDFRKKVWEHLEKNRLVNFPRPAFGRIPNFKGADEAAEKLSELEEFKGAKTVEVNPDKPLEAARVLVLANDKILYVPVPKLQEGLLKRISFCNEDKPENLRQTVNRWGIETLGKSVGFNDTIHIDLLVLGSVAVSRDGLRIGKGKGYADLEYAILKEMKAVDDDTVIVTTVHDSQVFDTLPKEIFKKHDVPLDYILTPTEIIKVEERLPRPEGIYWDLISQRKINLMPVLQKIKEAHSSEGRDTTLTEVDSDPEPADDKRRPPKPRSRFNPRRQPRARLIEENQISSSTTENERPRHKRYFRRTRVPRSEDVVTDRPPTPNPPLTSFPQADKENEGRAPIKKKPFKRNARRLQVDFSLVVSNIDKNVRVRQLKNALIESGIKPNNITWRGYKGFCYLHYAKPAKKDEVVEEKAFGVDNVIEILQTLKLNPESSSNLSVKVMEPITRIETTDVTSV